MADNTRVVNTFKTALTLLEDPSEAENRKFAWYSNGKRGFRHSNNRCSDLKVTSSLVTTYATLNEASERKICEKCFKFNTAQLSSNGRAFIYFLDSYIQLHNEVSRYGAAVNEATQFNVLFASLEKIKSLRKSLYLGIHGFDEFKSDHPTAFRKFDSMYDSFYNKISANLVKRESDVLKELSFAALDSELNSGNEIVSDTSILETLNVTGYYRSSRVVELYASWKKVRMGNVKEGNSENLLEATYSKFDLNELSQLKYVKLSSLDIESNPGEVSVIELAEAAWPKTRDSAAKAAIAEWDSKLEKIVSNNSRVCLVIHTKFLGYINSFELLEKLQVTSPCASEVDGKIALNLPKYAAEYIAKNATSRLGRGSASVQVYDKIIPNNVVDTALYLWDPSSEDGAYKSFAECVSASEALV